MPIASFIEVLSEVSKLSHLRDFRLSVFSSMLHKLPSTNSITFKCPTLKRLTLQICGRMRQRIDTHALFTILSSIFPNVEYVFIFAPLEPESRPYEHIMVKQLQEEIEQSKSMFANLRTIRTEDSHIAFGHHKKRYIARMEEKRQMMTERRNRVHNEMV